MTHLIVCIFGSVTPKLVGEARVEEFGANTIGNSAIGAFNFAVEGAAGTSGAKVYTIQGCKLAQEIGTSAKFTTFVYLDEEKGEALSSKCAYEPTDGGKGGTFIAGWKYESVAGLDANGS